MRSDGGSDERVAFPMLNEFGGVSDHLRDVLVVGNGKIDEGFAENAAHAGLFGDAGNFILEIVHVGVSGDAAPNHFQHAEARAQFDEIGSDVAGFGGKNVLLQPVVEGEVVGEAAKESHGGVTVAVDEAGHDDFAVRGDG